MGFHGGCPRVGERMVAVDDDKKSCEDVDVVAGGSNPMIYRCSRYVPGHDPHVWICWPKTFWPSKFPTSVYLPTTIMFPLLPVATPMPILVDFSHTDCAAVMLESSSWTADRRLPY